MRVAVGADHAGYELKDRLAGVLVEMGHEVIDLGTNGPDSVHYPDYAVAVARQVARGRVDRGVLVCGTGLGMSMVANRFRGVRAALCHDEYTATMARQHNDANVLALGARVLSPEAAEAVLRAFFSSDFEGGRHALRVAMIDDLSPPDTEVTGT